MKAEFIASVKHAIESVAGPQCVLHAPIFRGNEQRYVSDCIETGWVSSVGAYVDRLENDLADFTGAKYVIATSSGTSALHTALVVAGVRPNDEVIVPSLSFVATANAVSYCGAVPHFADVDSQTYGLDPEKLRVQIETTMDKTSDGLKNLSTGRRVSAIVPMHTFGHPCSIRALCELAERYSLRVVEDAAESLGSFYEGQHTGTFGTLGVLSFNGNKIATSGGGGAILTNDSTLAKTAKHLSTTAKVPHPWHYVHDELGFNYRMPNLNAALACAQLEQIEDFVRIKRDIATLYSQAFESIDGVSFFTESPRCTSNYWLNSIRLSVSKSECRDQLLAATNNAGVMTRPCWTPLNQLPMYQNCPSGSLTTTNALSQQILNIPSGVGTFNINS